MPLLPRIMGAVDSVSNGFTTAFGNIFAGANETGTRTSTIMMPTDTRREINFASRMALVKKSRWIFNNLGLFKRFSAGTARYSVGGGIVHSPATTDLKFNDAAEQYFSDWADNPLICDARGKRSFWRMQKAFVRALPKDGELFGMKVDTGMETIPGVGEKARLKQLQLLETQVIGSEPGTNQDYDPDGYQEGVLINSAGRHLSYKQLTDRVPMNRDLTIATRILAANMIHFADPERMSQIHGLPWAYHGLNSAIDILDLVALEKAATKLHSMMAASIKKKSTEKGKGFGSGLSTRDEVDANGRAIPGGKKRVVAFDNFAAGAGILQLGLDEEFQLFTSNRPATTFAGFIDFLVRDISWGMGISPEFMWSVAGLNGTNTRLILEDAAWFFEEIQQLVIELLCTPVYSMIILQGIDRGELPACTDPNGPLTCHWVAPRKVTIDEGKTGALRLEQLANCATTWDDIWGERGFSGKKKVHQRIDEIADAMDYSKQKGVPFELVMAQKPGAPQANDGQKPDKGNPAAAAETKGDDDE